MLIEYKISFSGGEVSVTQRIEPGASGPVQVSPPRLEVPGGRLEVRPGAGRSLGASFQEEPRISGEAGGGSGDKLDTGGGSGDKLDTGGGAPGMGMVISFGPVIVLGAGAAATGDRGGGSGDKTGVEGIS